MSSAVSESHESVSPHRRGRVRRIARLAYDAGVRKGALSVFDQAVVSGTSFVTSVIVGRMGSPEDLGVFYLALSLVLFARAVQEQVVSVPYMIRCHRRQEDALAAYRGSTLLHQFALTALTLLGLLGLGIALRLGFGPAGLASAVWVLLGAVPFLLLRDWLRDLAFAHLRPGTATLIDVTVAALQLGGLALLARLGLLSVTTAYMVMGGACAAAVLGWFVANRQPLRFVPAQVLTDWRQNWSLGKWALASQLVGSTTPYVMPWFLVMAHGEASTGLLAACTTLIGLGNMFVIGLTNLLAPRATRAWAVGGLDELTRVLRQTATLFATTLGVFCMAALVAGDLPAVLVYGDRYAGCGPILTLLALGLLVNSLGITAGNGLWAMERPSDNFAADLCMLIVTLTAVACLVPSWGVIGAATATLSGTTAGTLVRGGTLLRRMAAVRTAVA